MLPKPERLTKEDFKGNRPRVFFRGELFDIASVSLPTQKFACVIAKKTLKRAVDRNKAKRRVMNAIRKVRKEIEVPQKHSCIFYPKKISIGVPYSQLCDDIKKAFATLH